MQSVTNIRSSAPQAAAPQAAAPQAAAPQAAAPQAAAPQAAAPQAAAPQAAAPSEREVRQAVDAANHQLQASGANEQVNFRFEKSLQQLVVQVTDKKSGDVVREFPSKEFIALKIALRDANAGLLLDKHG